MQGYDADWFLGASKDNEMKARTVSRTQRKLPVKHDKRCNRTEIIFGTLNGWRRTATLYDKCPKVFHSAIALIAAVTIGRVY